MDFQSLPTCESVAAERTILPRDFVVPILKCLFSRDVIADLLDFLHNQAKIRCEGECCFWVTTFRGCHRQFLPVTVLGMGERSMFDCPYMAALLLFIGNCVDGASEVFLFRAPAGCEVLQANIKTYVKIPPSCSEYLALCRNPLYCRCLH